MRVIYPDTGLAYLCQLLGKSRQAYYQGQQIKDSKLAFATIASYNCKRPHQRLDGQTPQQVHSADNWEQDLVEEVTSESSTKKVAVKRVQDDHD